MSAARLGVWIAAGSVGICLVVLAQGCGSVRGPEGGLGDVPLTISVVADSPGLVSSVTLTTDGMSTIDAVGASASVERADGTSSRVTLRTDATGQRVTLGQATVTPSTADGTAADVAHNGLPLEADVPFLAEIVADTPNEISSVTVTALEAGDSFDIAGATARVEHPDGMTQPISLSINADANVVTMGRADLGAFPGYMLHGLVIDGPILVRDGSTGTATEVGGLGFYFQMLPDGTIIAPTSIRASIPTIGAARDGRVVVDGLAPNEDQVRTIVTDRDGGRTYSRIYLADASGQAVIPDTKSQITAEMLSGPGSRIEMWFFSWLRIPLPPPSPIGPVPVLAQGGLNALVIEGPIRVTNGFTHRATEIGLLRLAFEVLADGTVVAPTTIELKIPTKGQVGDPRMVVSGLGARDFARAAIVNARGARTNSRVHMADPSGRTVIADAQPNITARRLSGPDSQILLFFARTDADRDGNPDLF